MEKNIAQNFLVKFYSCGESDAYFCPICNTIKALRKNIFNKYDNSVCDCNHDCILLADCDTIVLGSEISNEIEYSYIKYFKYDKKSFYMEVQNYKYDISINQDNNDIEVFNLISENTYKVSICKEINKNNKEKIVAKLIINGREERFTKTNLHKYLYAIVNEEEITRLGITPPFNSVDECIWRLYTLFKSYLYMIEEDLGFIDCSRAMYEFNSMIKYVSTRPVVLKKLKEWIANLIKLNKKEDMFPSKFYSNRVKRDFPSDNERYYTIYDYLRNLEAYYYDNICESQLADLFSEHDYSEEEITSFLQAAYRQAYGSGTSFDNINRGMKIYKSIGIPVEKIPKEMNITENRYKVTNLFINKYRDCIEYKVEKIQELENVCIEEDPLIALKKMLSYKNNYKLLNSVLYEMFFKSISISYFINIKDTDYFLFIDNGNDIESIYYKTEKLENYTLEQLKKDLSEKGVA